MKIQTLTATALLGLSLQTVVLAQDNPLPAGFTAQPLLKSGVTRDNEPFVYPGGKPEMISVIGTLEVNGRTALHAHPIPVYVYVLEGEIELRTDGKQAQRYKAGDAFIESQNHKHQAFNVANGPTRLLVVFVGEAGKPTTIAAQ